jgi:hypothetical protein
MRSALYYPHTTVGSEHLIKTALLLWDRLEYIVPWQDFKPHYGRRDVAKAMELIGVAHPPQEDEKRETHTRLKELVTRKLPPQFYWSLHGSREPYGIYPQKFLPDSWELLRKAKLSGGFQSSGDPGMTDFGGLMVMSILAVAVPARREAASPTKEPPMRP